MEETSTYMSLSEEGKFWGFIERLVFIFKKKKKTHTCHSCTDPGSDLVSFLSKWYLHCICLCDFEALQCISCSACLHLVVKLHKGDVVATRNQTYLLESGEPEHNAAIRLTTNKKTPMKCREVTDWLNSMESMSSLVSSGRLVRKRMWLGGFSETCVDKGQINTNGQPGLQSHFLTFCFSRDNKKPTRYLLRHLSRHHGTRRHLTRCHPRGWHHARRGHIRWLTWHVHHTRGLGHRGHSLRDEGHQACLASILMPTMSSLYGCQSYFNNP